VCVVSADAGVLDYNAAYATLQTSSGDLRHHDPAQFDGAAFHTDNQLPVVDDSAAPPLRPPPPSYSRSADCRSTVDEPLLPDTDDAGAPDPDWENFSDLEFPRNALSLIDTLGTSSFGEVSCIRGSSHCQYQLATFMTIFTYKLAT